ncbi:MAG: SBBP repeat-containing protein [Flavobacteriales bacterium]|nr:SBBP repeat-containing protein [Flavobacteriales bacterium]
MYRNLKNLRFCSTLFIWLTLTLCAKAQTPYWAQRAGGATTDEAADISIDANGNSYTTGHFTASATFGNTTLSSYGVTDIFVCKIDPAGYFLWATRMGGTDSDRALSIRTDAEGNSYITGYFYGTATFGSQTLTSNGVQDVFVAKLDNAGNVLWAVSAGGSDSEIGNAVNVDANGNVAITGEFTGTATFGAQTLTSLNGSVDVFTAKLDANGNFLWAKKGSAPATDRGIDVAFDPAGNVYVTGQFTDTITFDNTHFNNTFNAIFLIKYDGSGTEQWFRRIGAAALNVVNGIAVDANSNVYLTGDFVGDVIFFAQQNTTLTHLYPNRIFLAKYSSAGSLLWAEADGSENEFTARNLALDDNGDPFIVGNFKCRLSSYSDEYGEGIFNSVGFWDVFVAEYSSLGQCQWSRSLGGRKDDSGNGITVDPEGRTIVSGSYLQAINFPIPDDFEIHETDSIPVIGGQYCNDDQYRSFRLLNSEGNSDAFITKIFDPAREPYDYYRRSGQSCDPSFMGVCIEGSPCPDTVSFCGFGALEAYSWVTNAGPEFTYVWSNGNTQEVISASQTDYYSVTQTTADGCFTSTDSIYVVVNPFPEEPFISDNIVINTNALDPIPIFLCSPDSVLLTGSGFGNNEHGWVGPTNSDNATIWATLEGNYTFFYKDENDCISGNTVAVLVDSLFAPIIPKMECIEFDDDGILILCTTDSITICEQDSFVMLIYDSLTNPTGNLACITDAGITWSVTPTTVSYNVETGCIPVIVNAFYPEQSGTYFIEAEVLRINHCDTDLVFVSHSIYVELNPLPNLGPVDIDILGGTNVCPGDSILLVATQALNYLWEGPGVDGNMNDSVWVSLQGTYFVSTASSDTNSFGCSASVSAIDSIFVTVQTQPEVTMTPSNGVICPNDSVLLTADGVGSFVWQGPSGPVGEDQSSVYVTTPGIYYCIRTDLFGCEVVSNSVEVFQYATPLILVDGPIILCQGESVILSVISNLGSSIEWQPPLSGNETAQTVSQAGIYTCLVTSCGIETAVSVEVFETEVAASVTVVGAATVCEGDSVLLEANAGQNVYQWNPNGEQDTEIMVFESGNYSVTTFDENGCSVVSNPVTVTMIQNTVSTPLVSDTAICPEGYAELVATANGTVNWYDAAEEWLFTGAEFTTPQLSTSATYQVEQEGAYCISEKKPVYVSIDDCDGIETPTVFSPNGDGVNDIFYFPQKGITCFDCRIYNRWGRLLYRWNDPNAGWDGTIQRTGVPVQDGVYYYLLEYCNHLDKRFSVAGYVHVFNDR